MVAAFAAVARHEDMIGGTIKITAFDDVPSRSGGQPASHGPPPGSCNLVAFPAGGWGRSAQRGQQARLLLLQPLLSGCSCLLSGMLPAGWNAPKLPLAISAPRRPMHPRCCPWTLPAGLRWEGLAVEQVGLAVALATAINPQQLPLTPAERKALNDRQVRLLGGVGEGWGGVPRLALRWRISCVADSHASPSA